MFHVFVIWLTTGVPVGVEAYFHSSNEAAQEMARLEKLYPEDTYDVCCEVAHEGELQQRGGQKQ